ncbi:Pycsar system effector family protein [Streptomyces sp. NPDC093510]|uniref:Pycsar system effector family protein n=1 Tax=Streptomyces sp. NPDC093510 TaxID=3155199 RepID=UPI00343AC9BE
MAGEPAAATDVGHQQARSDNAWRILDTIRDWTKHAETKAATTLAAAGVVAGVLYSLVTGSGGRSAWFASAAAVSAVCTVAAGLTAGLVLWPRQRIAVGTMPTSLLFYDHIGREYSASHSEYRDRLNELLRDEDALLAAVVDQIWANALVARRKFGWVSRSIGLLLFALLGLAVAAVLSAAETAG